jgi:MOSC domain-containing protein YiiM
MPARLLSVNVGRPQPIERRGRVERTAIVKAPVSGRVAVRGVNVEGDDQGDRSVHGGPDRAVYAYASEDYAWWSAQLARALGAGSFGENLTLEGLDVTQALVGERWAVGSVVLEVSCPRIPCWKLARRMEDPLFVRRFAEARRPGTYLRIVEEGELGAGDAVEVLARPAHEVTIALFNEAYLHDRSLLGGLLAAEALPSAWREWIEERAA